MDSYGSLIQWYQTYTPSKGATMIIKKFSMHSSAGNRSAPPASHLFFFDFSRCFFLFIYFYWFFFIFIVFSLLFSFIFIYFILFFVFSFFFFFILFFHVFSFFSFSSCGTGLHNGFFSIWGLLILQDLMTKRPFVISNLIV